MSVVTFHVISDVDDSDVEDVTVRVFSEAGDVFVTMGVTDSDGELVLDLDDDTYWVRFSKIGFAFQALRTMVVDGDGTYEVEAQDINTHPPSTDVNLCRVSGTIVNGAGAPAAGVTLYFMLTGEPRVVAGRVMLPSKIYATSDDDGYVEFDLVCNGIYESWAQGTEDVTYRTRVPDYPWVDLADLLWPYVSAVAFDTGAMALDVGEDGTTTPTITLSNRLTLPYTLDDSDSSSDDDFDIEEVIEFASSNVDVATVSFDGATLTVTGVSAGTTTISASVIAGTINSRQPSPSVSFGTVDVTVT